MVEAKTYHPGSNLPFRQREHYERGLDRINRWEHWPQIGVFRESDLDHVNAMLAMVDEFRSVSPTFVLELQMDLLAVKNIVYVHDAGELIKG